MIPFVHPIVTDELQKKVESRLNEENQKDRMKFFYPVPYIEEVTDKRYTAYEWRYVIASSAEANYGKLVGYISASFDPNTDTISNLGFIKLDRLKTEIFDRCLLGFIEYCFEERNINSITLKSIPGCAGHKYIMRNFVEAENESFYTEVVGELKGVRKLRDGTVHNSTIFQMLKKI